MSVLALPCRQHPHSFQRVLPGLDWCDYPPWRSKSGTRRLAFYLEVETGTSAEEICSQRPEDIHFFDGVLYVHVASGIGAE